MENRKIKGISVCNPVELDREYLLYTINYAAQKGFNHLQIIGPIHDYVKGNIDGMIMYDKYRLFNDKKDAAYVDKCTKIVNEATNVAYENNIKTYMWHHELYLPDDFQTIYPEVLNDAGDIEVSHPLVRNFIENKIQDFFRTYPKLDGIILTLHETQIPLLKLKNQKLGEKERVRYITEILYHACVAAKKELIVRPFASIEEDYAMIAKAYEEISEDLIVMDKWTQFDWSLTMPDNQFYHKIKNNPLLVEADIFGEFFGKGRLPLLLLNHIQKKFEYCEKFSPLGYVARIDRNGQIPFGDVNEVNIDIFHACLEGKDPEKTVNDFFENKYKKHGKDVQRILAETEDVLKKTIYINGYLFSELSIFPSLNHCKNHYYFEIMRKNACIDSNEWYIPASWDMWDNKHILEEKKKAVEKAEHLYQKTEKLKGKIDEIEYEKLWIKFLNLKYVTKIWYLLAEIHMEYIKYFETKNTEDIVTFENSLKKLKKLDDEGKVILGDKFYCRCGNHGYDDFIGTFIKEIRNSFYAEKDEYENTEESNLLDFVICGGGTEGHRLQKEVNFSDTFVHEGQVCRIMGNKNSVIDCKVNSHGWFSYLIQVSPYSENTIKISMQNPEGVISCQVQVGEEKYKIYQCTSEKTEVELKYKETQGNASVRIRLDRNSFHVPYIYTIKVMR